MSDFTSAELAKEAAREVGMREFVYPDRVEKGLMTHQLAAKRIAMMKAIVERLAAEAEAEEASGRLL